MNLQLSEEQTLLRDTFSRLFGNESSPERVRAAEPLGFDPALWRQWVAVGGPLLRVSESADGAGATLFDAVLVAEQIGRYLASAPLIESIAAASILSRLEGDAAKALLTTAVEGAIVTLALFDAAKQPSQLVPGGAICSHILVLDGDVVYSVTGTQTRQPPSTLGATPIAQLAFDDPSLVKTELARGPSARNAFLGGLEEWRLLTAASLAGNARKALDDAAAYACERQAFDRQIGSYQGLAHPLADAVTDVEGAQYLVWWAAWKHGSGSSDAAALTPLAFWWAAQAARVGTVRAIRVYGGYGVSDEYPVQLHYRRARAQTLLAGDPDDALSLAADRMLGDTAPPIPDVGESGIDFALGSAADRYAEQAREFFKQNLTPELREFSFETGDGFDPDFHRQLAQAGFMFSDWPKAWGGADRSGAEISALYRVYGENDWWVTVPNTTDMVAKMVLHFGSEELKQEVLPQAARGELNFSLGYSEPSCGSDIFAAKTKAVRESEDGDWVINGQKMFTSQGHLAQYCLMVARTNPAAAKHAGITLFLLPLDQAGYQVSAVHTLGGELTNVTYYTDMRVSDKYRLGAVDGGSKVLAAALVMEQSGGDFFLLVLNRMLRDAMDWAKANQKNGQPALQCKEVRRALARLRAHIDVLEALTRRAMWGHSTKQPQRFFGPMTKLFGSEAIVRCGAEWMELGAPESLLQTNSPLGRIELEARRGIAGTIYAGTSEVQRSIIAETALGLPRTRS